MTGIVLQVLAALSVYCVGFGIVELTKWLFTKRQQEPQRHPCLSGHDLVLIEAQPHEFNTFVRYRCKRCEIHATSTINGSWKLEELHKRQNDISTLEGMVRQ